MSTAVITGASRGLGFELCRIYLAQGWLVFPVVRREEAKGRFRAAPADQCRPIVADLRSDDAIAAVADAVTASTDHIDLLVNNAGLSGNGVQLATVAPQEILALLEVHCLGAVRCTQAVLPQLVSAVRPRVINVTSRLGSLARNAAGEFAAEPVSYSYRIAKAAQNMLTVCMSQELGERGVIVCALHPGQFRSELNPDANSTAAAAAESVARWADRMAAANHGRWYDASEREIQW
jgi:NAD(P)-dependent dehydrogenase (short-subunit alcohol dehydrogenase family)